MEARWPTAWIIGAAFLAPWMGWVLLSTPQPNVAVLQTPQWVFAVGGLLALSAWIAQTDPWLGLFTGWLTVRGVTLPHPLSFEVMYTVAFGAAMLTWLRQTPFAWLPRIRQGLVLLGAAQAVYVIVQSWGWDPIWAGWTRTWGPIVGTLGNGNYAGWYLGMLWPLAPWWLWPLYILGIAATKSYTGMMMGMVGLSVRYLWMASPWAWALMLSLFVGWVLVWFPISLRIRALVWTIGLQDLPWWGWLIGLGPGAWIARLAYPMPGVVEIFLQAHHEYLQLLYEGGLVALVLLAGWLWTHRGVWTVSPWNGPVVAILLGACTMFPFHLAALGLTALVIVGVALRAQEGRHAG